jgi:hypothetical protein
MNRSGKFVAYEACACGNEARYVNERNDLCCGLCPLREGLDSVLIANKERLHQWVLEHAARTGFDPEEEARIRERYLFQTGNDHWLDQAVDELRWARRYLDSRYDTDPNHELRSLLGRRPSRDQNTLGAERKGFLSVDASMNTDD